MNELSERLQSKHVFKNYIDPKNILPYTVGALLYSPATNDKIASAILNKKIDGYYSLALCLEDSICDTAVAFAENQIVKAFQTINAQIKKGNILFADIPKIFIRVRNPNQVIDLFDRLEDSQELLFGFIFPKYSLSCSNEYNANILKINSLSNHTIYMMPIIESDDIVTLHTRPNTLHKLKISIDSVSEYVLNIRVGGNDFCRGFGIRRHYDETIYDILAVSNILSDIITTFAKDYVVSAPVWDYFVGNNEKWAIGLMNELKHDKINGFIGKTAIHPSQIPLINESLKVRKNDLRDAYDIMEFKDDKVMVVKSGINERMNEIKIHMKWAKKIIILASIYGVTE